MTVKTDIFLFTPWFPHLALFQRLKRRYQDGSDAAITLVQHPLHWDTPSCPGRGYWLSNSLTICEHSGGEQSLGETKYIIGDSYTVGKVWASTFGINWQTNLPLGAFWENAKIAIFAPKNNFGGKKKAIVCLYLQSWTWSDVIIILGIKFWWFSFF